MKTINMYFFINRIILFLAKLQKITFWYLFIYMMKKAEEYFIKKILFDDSKIDNKIISNLNYERLIQISSRHLVLTTLYSKILEKKLSHKFPKKFINYLDKVHSINKSRNEQLINEVLFLTKILNEKKISHVFLKGVSHIFSNLYENIGERMIGDIDFLFESDKKSKVEEILDKSGYRQLKKNDFLNFRHMPRRISVNNIFAIEPHFRITDSDKLDTNKILEGKVMCNGCYCPNFEDQFLINILNFQYNNYGNNYFSHSYRNLYDSFLLSKNLKNYNLKRKEEYSNYFFVAENLGLKNFSDIISKYELKKTLRFKVATQNIIILKINKYLNWFFLRINFRTLQLKEVFINSKYRSYLFRKIKRVLIKN